MSAPDVSVVLPVYNTMPYLTKCLTSLVEQSIGLGRMEIIAIDDGSTDGSSRELGRFASRYPGAIEVIHQRNSGGPAGPCNRGLERATGRYVFFVGSDDYLGREALERLVAAADEYSADVVLGKVVGVNSRQFHQEVFARDALDISLFDSALPWSLANTKLFRRDLIEQYGLRYPEDMPILSDQPFTIEACFRARRISVLAGYDFYYAVRRLNARNITYLSSVEDRLRCAQRLVAFVAGLIEPGAKRDAVLRRHFATEVAALVRDDFVRLDRTTQERVHSGVRALAEQYLTEGIAGRLDIETRLRLSVAGQGGVDDLLAMIRHDAEQGVPATVEEDGRWYAAYPGFRSTRSSLPDGVFDVTEAAADWLAKLDVAAVGWERGTAGQLAMTVTARSPRHDLVSLCASSVRVRAGELDGTVLSTTVDGTTTTVRARFSVAEVLAASAATGQRRAVRVGVNAFGGTGTAALRAPRFRPPRPRVVRRGSRLFVITPTKDPSGALMISVVPLTPGRVLARLVRRRR